MLKLAPILKEISKDFRMGGHDGSGGHDGKLHQAFTLVMEWEAVEYLKVSRWDQKSQITTVELVTKTSEVDTTTGNHQHITETIAAQDSATHTVTNEFIELMKEQLREKDKQLREKDNQLKSKDELLKLVQEQTNDKDNAQILALSEIIRLNKKLLPPPPGESVIDVDANGYQSG